MSIRHYGQDELAARVKALNAVNKHANHIHGLLTTQLRPFLGQKVVKVDGSLTERAKKAVYIPPFGKIQIYKASNTGSLAWTVKTSEIYGLHTCTYAETTVYIGVLDGDKLESLHEYRPRRTDLTVDEVNRLRADYETKQEIATKAEHELYGTGLF